MNHIQDFFDKIIVINLSTRPDRWEKCIEQFKKYNLHDIIRFEAHDLRKSELFEYEDKYRENFGCVASHRGVLELICSNKWNRTLVLEDDFEIIHEDFHARFCESVVDLPSSWDIFYLGAVHVNKPYEFITPRIKKINAVHTTSSYGITLDYARKICPYIYGVGPIDDLYLKFHKKFSNSYVIYPRLIVQSAGFSDLQKKVVDYTLYMKDL